MIRRPPRSTPLYSSAASDVYKRQGFDHTQFLGDTLPKIAFEKAGVIKRNIPVVIGEYADETKPVFEEKATFEDAPIVFAQDNSEVLYDCALKGDYQKQNMKTVLKAVELLQNAFEISDLHIQNGFKKVISNTGLLGRWQILNEKPFVVTDTAHNAHGLKIVLSQIQKHEFETLHIVLGVVNDKDLDSILPLFPKNAKYYFCKPNLPRGLDAAVLRDVASKYGLKGMVYNSVTEAYENALDSAIVTDFIYVGGSTFVVAEII